MGMVMGDNALVSQILVAVGQKVKSGDELLYVEMQKGVMPIIASGVGAISKILVSEGDEIKEGDLLVILDDGADAGLTMTSEAAVPQKESTQVDTDLLIIGGGPGGYVAAIYAAQKGLRVVLAEKNRLGGTCLNQGCIPTKALVKSSLVYRGMLQSGSFGIKADPPTVNMDQVIERKNMVVSRLVGGVEGLMKDNNITVLKGWASFGSGDAVSVDCADTIIQVSAKHTIISTGSSTKYLDIPGRDASCVIDSARALDMETLPESITIVGGGVIGLEFAFIYANFGVPVTILEYMDRLIPTVDPAVSEEIERIAKARGIAVHTSAKVLRVQEDIAEKAVTYFEKEERELCVISERVLMAVGRRANLDGLGLDAAGIHLNDKGTGIKVNSRMKTNIDAIYAIGDVTDTIQLAHVASRQGMVAVDNILGQDSEMEYHAVPSVVFTEPEIASVGKTPADSEDGGVAYRCSQFPYMANGKAVTMNETEGFIKLTQDSNTGKIIGGSIIGADASALIATITLAIENGLDAVNIAKTIFAHPTTSEAIHEASLGLGIGALHIPRHHSTWGINQAT